MADCGPERRAERNALAATVKTAFEEKTLRKLSVLLLPVLVACTTTTGVVPIGQDTYMVGGSGKSPGGYSGAEVKAAAFREATQFCAGQGKKMQVVNTNERDMSFGVNATAEVQFMCLADGDQELGRPKLQRTADQVIQVVPSAQPPQAVRDQAKDTYAELLKLEDLRKRGILNDAEFDAQKKKLLSAK